MQARLSNITYIQPYVLKSR